MNRRGFLGTTATILPGAALAMAGLRRAAAAEEPSQKAFRLHYAPHFGMFKNLAGDDLIDQLGSPPTRASPPGKTTA